MPPNPSTPSPATAPAEAPEIKSIQELQQKKADILGYLQSVPGLSPEEKAKFAEEFEKDMVALDTKTEEEKKKDIGSLKAEIAKLQADIHGEKKDTNEQMDTVTGSDETTVEADQKLVEKEIRGRLDEFRASIDTKLAAPETPPTASPEPAEEVPPETQDAINSAKEFFSNKGVKLDTVAPVQWNFLKNFFNKILLSFYGLLEWFGIDVRNQKARIEGYKNYESKQIVDETFRALAEYAGNSLGELSNIRDRENLVEKIRWLGLPLVSAGNILAGPLMKFIFTGDEEVLKDLPEDIDQDTIKAVRGKYLTLRDNPRMFWGMNTAEKLNAIFTIEEDQKNNYLIAYDYDQEARNQNESENTQQTTVVEAPEEERPETPQEKLDALDAAERADKKLEEAIRDNQAGHPDIELAQKEVDAIKNHSKDSLISALETTEDHLNKTKDLLKITQQEKEKAEVANDTAKMAQLEKEIGRMTTLITNLEWDHGIIARLKNIAKEMIENPDALRKDWKIKESLTAKNTVEQAQKAENEVEKMYSIMEGKEKEEQKKDEATEKVDEKMKKWNELYQEVKKSELGYIHKKEEGRIYIINNGNLFRYKYQGGIIDTAQNWLRSWFDRDLPVDIDTFETIQILDKNGTWADSGAQTNYWFHESWWLKKSTRISHNADAPENLNYYTS